MKAELIKIIGEALGAIFASLLIYLAPKVKAWLISKIGALETDKLITLAKHFVQSAEQILKKEDPTGAKRKEYVIGKLQEMGYEITDELLALIESAVYEVNQGVKNEH